MLFSMATSRQEHRLNRISRDRKDSRTLVPPQGLRDADQMKIYRLGCGRRYRNPPYPSFELHANQAHSL